MTINSTKDTIERGHGSWIKQHSVIAGLTDLCVRGHEISVDMVHARGRKREMRGGIGEERCTTID